MGERQEKRDYLAQAWLVIVLALLYGGALATVQTALSGRIAENKRNETYNVIPDLVPGADKARTAEVVVVGGNGKEVRVYRAFSPDGTPCGWVLPSSGQGFADRIELLVGLDAPCSVITGVYILDQKETPGLGDYITGEDFRDRFRAKPTAEPLVVVKTDPRTETEIRVLTGATISSESVSGIVNAAVRNLKGPLLGLIESQVSPAPETRGVETPSSSGGS